MDAKDDTNGDDRIFQQLAFGREVLGEIGKGFLIS